jgi:hypothetical protein
MHWTLATVLLVIVVFAAGAWYSKSYPGTIPFVT